MLAASDVARSPSSSPPGSGVVPRRPVQQCLGVAGVQVGQDQPHAQRVPVQPLQQLAERPPRPPRRRRRVGGQQVPGILRRPPPAPGRRPDAADRAPSQSSAVRLVMITALRPPAASRCQEALQLLRISASSSGGVAPAGSGIERTVSKLSQISSSRRSRQQLLAPRRCAARRPGGRNRGRTRPGRSR